MGFRIALGLLLILLIFFLAGSVLSTAATLVSQVAGLGVAILCLWIVIRLIREPP